MTVNTIALVPSEHAVNPITIPGTTRTYSGAIGSLTFVPDFDALIMRNAGWVATNTHNSGGSAGPTFGRPAYPAIDRGFCYIDTTLNVVAIFVSNQLGWVNAATGASV